MLMRMSHIIRLLIFTAITLQQACEKNDPPVKGDVAIYLIETYETMDQSCAIDLLSVQVAAHPLIPYSDMVSYDSGEHILKITSQAMEAVQELEHSVTGLPFAVNAGDQVIYTGYFWPSYSSASCDWIVIDPFMNSGTDELKISLGYPGPTEGATVPDERNNPLLLAIFKRDGKLREK